MGARHLSGSSCSVEPSDPEQFRGALLPQLLSCLPVIPRWRFPPTSEWSEASPCAACPRRVLRVLAVCCVSLPCAACPRLVLCVDGVLMVLTCQA